MSRRGATWQGFWAVAWALGCRKRTLSAEFGVCEGEAKIFWPG